ncbi:hypothetical protein SK571_27765 [Lentzea sp. BCCO 10_0798]|jgi:hypothetical protein|uniref:Uncharacterized protein n=1 Tax=Lentzea kristufekii TaxID=3095430 RepID=A0ABU4TXZ9_9PSEU|nr:hypothetical protein [Lentzea sp. BCCO 10_0798]MDX8053193.1 hypothetical protein [Lentzea sp. BCCO 10_0798]
MFPAPPPAVRRGTPFLHCMAGAAVWYVASITVQVIVAYRTGYGAGGLRGALVGGGIIWLLTALVTWLIALKVRIKPWVLIFLTLPLYLALSFLVAMLFVVVGVAFQLVVR